MPRKHIEHLGDGEDQAVKLGTFIDNSRRRADKLTVARREALSALDIRWT